MDEHVEDHYTHLAETYDSTWAHRPDYLDWMEEQIHSRLSLSDERRLADIGAGTGLFLRRLMRHAAPGRPIVCVDPSRAMLDRLPSDPRLVPVRATAEELAGGGVELPWSTFDGIIIKEAVHHFTALESTMAGLAGLLAPGGQILVVTLPPRIGYPLFPEALDRFAAGHPEPRQVEEALRAAGLRTATEFAAFPVRIDRGLWMKLVEGRWMSVLSSFTEAELTAGLQWIAEHHPGPTLEFDDRFAFITGRIP
ncbi:methyltransferase domain-containing protein [Streptomyces sp. ACA25]|uniref:class I SAM-dependent DNA methyltransferase n=1 Tax=Streptomyces sp. ACA25 TaxID=3022596 RepID=UPI0023083229|nr:class I SAM-dependent methyltransferase [Streptomyces sp. ACA25]MDB1087785.1 methyltransferase domain-containing protein [Streptomyces sp. ACA25]